MQMKKVCAKNYPIRFRINVNGILFPIRLQSEGLSTVETCRPVVRNGKVCRRDDGQLRECFNMNSASEPLTSLGLSLKLGTWKKYQYGKLTKLAMT